ncbi:glycogen-binding domain-containing protein [Anaeromyxobacter oryzae]|uniref:glycogen-binding domain-containing protein n=1 Tax=Anaeromyxobacter oryzae TaxID=2918170 RepID=UPI0020BD5759|nr:glycogen-binding domain-containing protein [Anaeromyxobacter oryzae]
MNGVAPLLRRARAALLAVSLGCATAPRAPAAAADAEGAVLRYDGAADAVYVCGTMTGWEPVPLERDARGFGLTLPLPPGRYEYRLEVHRGGEVQVVVPEGAERTDDGFGGENAIVRVP